MERLMAVTTFQKAIDSLKTTECRYCVESFWLIIINWFAMNYSKLICCHLPKIFYQNDFFFSNFLFILLRDSQKEKLALFTQISDCIQSPALRGNINYLGFVSNAVSILLMFCEDIDSVVRMRYFRQNYNWDLNIWINVFFFYFIYMILVLKKI